MYQNILLPTDGSERSREAIDPALPIASQFDATIHALSVAEMVQQKDQLRADAKEEAERALDEVETQVTGENIDVTRAIRTGMPGEEILQYVDQNDVDMIIMGTQGKTGLNRVLLGSIAEKIIRESPVPVMTVRPTE